MADLEKLRAELAAKKAANEAKSSTLGMSDEEKLRREIAIEDKRQEAYESGLLEEQLLECEWPGIGKCLARTPSNPVYQEFAMKSGMLRGELVNDPAVHKRLAKFCMLVPTGDEFLAMATERNPHAPIQFGSAMLERMRGRLGAEGK